MVQAAARFALYFGCSPFEFLDRPTSDLPVLLALMQHRDQMIEKEAT